MTQYHLPQWLAFFFFYCFLGWVWECLYVSFLKKKWVNRGFLHGPYLPIYGFGAIFMLFFTIPVRGNIPATFLFGMTGASLLEYFTGVLMEKLFHIRYWDYSDQRFNLNGHICLGCSLGWGALSVLLVRFLHEHVAALIDLLPRMTLGITVFVLTLIFMWDVSRSAIEALDLKNILHSEDAKAREILRLQKRLDVLAAFIAEDSEKFKQKLAKYKLEPEILREKFAKYLPETEDWKEKLAKYTPEMEELREKIARLTPEMEELKETLNKHAPELGELKEKLTKYSLETNTLKEKLADLKTKSEIKKDNRYQRAEKILRRNPTSTSSHYKKALEEIRELLKLK